MPLWGNATSSPIGPGVVPYLGPWLESSHKVLLRTLKSKCQQNPFGGLDTYCQPYSRHQVTLPPSIVLTPILTGADDSAMRVDYMKRTVGDVWQQPIALSKDWFPAMAAAALVS